MYSKHKHIYRITVWIILCTILNVVLAFCAQKANLPLYMDCIGTILAGAVCGYLPGIITGIATSLINGLVDSVNIYYCSISIMIACVSAFASKRGWLKKYTGIAGLIIILSLIGGGLGAVLTWFLYGKDFGTTIALPLTEKIYGVNHGNAFLIHLISNFLMDIPDKAVSVLATCTLIRCMPTKIFDPVSAWKITEKQEITKNSLRFKMLCFIALTMTIPAIVISAIFYTMFRNTFLEEESKMAYGVAETAASTFDANRVEEYINDGKSDDYLAIEKRLQNIALSSENIQYVYVYQIQEDGCHVVFDPDTSEEGSETGDIITFDEAFMPYVPALLAGEEIEPIISNEKYGWLLSVYKPVYDDNGTCRCYVGVDLSMSRIANEAMIFLTKICALFTGFLITFLAIGATMAEKLIIKPVNQIAQVSVQFASDNSLDKQEGLNKIQALNINTNDELEHLYHAIYHMAEELSKYIRDIRVKNEKINRLQNGLIIVLAELVESRDTCTGNHIKNTAKYVQLIMEQMKEDGMDITDDYTREVVSSAPLHDVGKIKVSDVILNKPGKLTDEEYTQMKIHTVTGGEIIDEATRMFSDDDEEYLMEAKNLAMSHHERWDGKGYPNGLKEKEIPLSARIMAVADVLDALVARRSYKEGMPFDKAVEIIKSGAGTQFDPVVVDEFLKVADNARVVAETTQGIRKTEEQNALFQKK